MLPIRRLSIGLFATLHAVPLLCAKEPEIVMLRGEKFQVWPRENLVKRGFDIADVPRAENAAWVYVEAINKYAHLPSETEQVFEYACDKDWPRDHQASAKLSAYLNLTENREALALMHQASLMERHQMPHFGDPEASVVAVLLPNLSSIRFLCKLAVADGRRLEAEDHPGEAVERYLTAMRMGEQVAGEGATVIESLVGIAAWSIANDALMDHVLRKSPSAAHLEKLESELERRAEKAPGIESGLRSERAFGMGVVDEMCAAPLIFPLNVLNPGQSGWFSGADRLGSPEEDGWGLLAYRIGQLVLPDKAIKRHMNGYYDAIERRAREGRHSQGAAGFDEGKYINEKIPKWDAISRTMLPSLRRAVELGELVRARQSGTRAVMAIVKYMQRNEGRAPDSLDAVQESNAQDFVDPFSGKPLIYRKTTDGWMLYSIGPNLKDDGGRTGKRRDDLDVVWSFPPTEIAPFAQESEGEEP